MAMGSTRASPLVDRAPGPTLYRADRPHNAAVNHDRGQQLPRYGLHGTSRESGELRVGGADSVEICLSRRWLGRRKSMVEPGGVVTPGGGLTVATGETVDLASTVDAVGDGRTARTLVAPPAHADTAAATPARRTTTLAGLTFARPPHNRELPNVVLPRRRFLPPDRIRGAGWPFHLLGGRSASRRLRDVICPNRATREASTAAIMMRCDSWPGHAYPQPPGSSLL